MKAFLKQAIKSVEWDICPRFILLTNAATFCKVNAYSSISANKLSVCGNIGSLKQQSEECLAAFCFTLMKVIENSCLTVMISWYFMKHLVEFLMWVWKGAVFVRDRLDLIGTTDQVDSTNQWRKSEITQQLLLNSWIYVHNHALNLP